LRPRASARVAPRGALCVFVADRPPVSHGPMTPKSLYARRKPACISRPIRPGWPTYRPGSGFASPAAAQRNGKYEKRHRSQHWGLIAGVYADGFSTLTIYSADPNAVRPLVDRRHFTAVWRESGVRAVDIGLPDGRTSSRCHADPAWHSRLTQRTIWARNKDYSNTQF
jgi:hypothetical protein